MVFPDDEAWQQGFADRGCRYNANHVRFRSFGTEEMLVRLVRKNMPFVRDVIILLARESQRQPWMDEDGVRVVYHGDFMPKKYLPTFNSRAMEMFLHRITGLSERFLYGNDDMYPLSPLEETDFFRDGKPCVVMKEHPFPKNPSNFQSACLCGLNFVGREFGRSFKTTWYKNGHSIAPILRSTAEHLWSVGGREIEASVTPFRECHNFNQYIYSWWQWMSGNYFEYAPRRTYVSVACIHEAAEALLSEDPGIVCVNDSEIVRDVSEIRELLQYALRKRL